MRNTIQITQEENQQIEQLKTLLKLPSKRAVVLEGLRGLREKYQMSARRQRLRAASQRCREESLEINQEMAPLGTGSKIL